eukprot:1189399-Prorocentrum_minimum.AAC.2
MEYGATEQQFSTRNEHELRRAGAALVAVLKTNRDCPGDTSQVERGTEARRWVCAPIQPLTFWPHFGSTAPSETVEAPDLAGCTLASQACNASGGNSERRSRYACFGMTVLLPPRSWRTLFV